MISASLSGIELILIADVALDLLLLRFKPLPMPLAEGNSVIGSKPPIGIKGPPETSDRFSKFKDKPSKLEG